MDVTATTSAEAVDITASSIMRAMSMSPLKPINSCATYGATRPASKKKKKKQKKQSPHRIVHSSIFMPSWRDALPCLAPPRLLSCVTKINHPDIYFQLVTTLNWVVKSHGGIQYIYSLWSWCPYLFESYDVSKFKKNWRSKRRQDITKQIGTETRTHPIRLCSRKQASRFC